jgi:hypothetical protein
MTPTVKFEQVFTDEIQAIRAKRMSIGEKDILRAQSNLFGIALSGGGVRSATISAGFLEILRACGILKKADYLSTVSGGGYTGGYIQSKLHRTSDVDSLFSTQDQKFLQGHGDYLAPGRKLMRFMTKIRLAGAFVASLLMNWVWIVLVAMILTFSLDLIAELLSACTLSKFLGWVLWGGVAVLCVHYFLHFLRHYNLWSSDVLNWAEGVLLTVIIVAGGLWLSTGTRMFGLTTYSAFLLSAAGLVVLGFFGNPNILSMHRFYRDRLGEAFLDAAGRGSDRLRLHELVPQRESGGQDCRPYPLFNTCLNLLSRDDLKFPGAKVSDYFILSPKYVGSRTTGYLRTDAPEYRRLTLSTAVAVSGAALNPNMGTKTNRILAFIMSLLNLQLGYWAFNPAYHGSVRLPITWWPYYHLLQLLCKTDSTRSEVNLSDGGHIENLGVYELLRRRCKLIIALDAGDDPHYDFDDLKNLIIRARNELGISITFRKNHRPEDKIRPSPSSGFSEAQFAVADIGELKGKAQKTEKYAGVLIYVKSSLVQPAQWRELNREDPEYWSFTYKTLHPDFPHESTADQFFDDDQWEAYYKLGRFMAGDLLNINLRDTKEYDVKAGRLQKIGVDELCRFFSGRG